VIITAFSLRPEMQGFVSIGVSFQECLDTQALLATPNVSRRTVTG
jgi:hypothetical protein